MKYIIALLMILFFIPAAQAKTIGFIGASDTCQGLYTTAGQEYATKIKDALEFDTMEFYVFTSPGCGAKLQDRTSPAIPGMLSQADSLIADDVDLALVACCSNDAETASKSLSEIKTIVESDFEDLVEKFTTANQPVLFVLDGLYGGVIGDERIRFTNEIMKEKLEAAGVPYFDMYEHMIADQKVKTYTQFLDWYREYAPDTYDWQHMSVQGHTWYADAVEAHIRQYEGLWTAVFGDAGGGGGGGGGGSEPTDGYSWFDNTQSGTNLTYGADYRVIQQPSGDTGGSAIGKHGFTDKRCFEIAYTTATSPKAGMIGFTNGAYNLVKSLATTGSDDAWYDSSGRLNTNTSPAESTTETVWDTSGNEVMACADAATGKIWFLDKNCASTSGASLAQIAAGTSPDFTLSSGTFKPIAGLMSGAAVGNILTGNFGQAAFNCTLPSGYAGILD